MPDSPPKSPPPPSENPQIPEIQNPNPNSDSAEIDPPEKSQPKTLESENPSPKSPFEETQKNPDQETHPIEEKPRVFVDVDEEQVDEEMERDEEDEDYVEQEEQEEGITMNLSSLPKSIVTRNSKNAGSSVRRNKKRKGSGKKVNQAALQKKMKLLSEVFKPIPFLQRKVADFPKHEENLRKLGLWDFAHIEFDRNIRVDLLVELIAGYSSKNRRVYVGECRLMVNRADLARALKLPVGKVPVKKQASDCEGESYPSEFLSFLEEFVSNWMVLHECDVWVTPNEIVNWMKKIKEGCPQKVDWAGLMWFMVEKELVQGSGLRECFYASHLQQLIKDQKGHLLQESPKVVVEKKVLEVILEDQERAEDTEMLDAEKVSVGEEKSADQCPEPESRQNCLVPLESSGAPDMAEKECNSDMARNDCDADMLDRDTDIMFGVNMVNGDNDINVAEKDGTACNLEKVDDDANRVIDEENVPINEADGIGYITNIDCAHGVENSAGMSRDNMVDVGDCSGVAQGQWHLDGRKDGGQHFMQRCSLAGLEMSTEDATFEDAGEEVQDDEDVANELMEGFEIRQKVTMDGTASQNFMQSFETGDLQYTSASLGGQSSLGLMPSIPENDVGLDDSSLFNHVGKREISFDHEISHHALDDNHKRRRIDGHWDQKAPDVGMCMDQMMHLIEKAKRGHETVKEQAYQHANMAQFYANQVAEKDAEIMQWRYKFDELERAKHADVSRRDRELHLMNGVIVGYRRALKETQRAFAEYRKRCKIPDEPVYKDAGVGGVVKSVMELERDRLKEEEEQRRTRHVLQQTYTTQITEYERQWDEIHGKVMFLDSRLTEVARDVQVLKNDLQERKMSKDVVMSEEVQSEAREEHHTKAMSPDDKLTTAEEEVEPTKDDILKPEVLSENIVLSEEVQSEAQGHSSPLHNIDGRSDPAEEVPKV